MWFGDAHQNRGGKEGKKNKQKLTEEDKKRDQKGKGKRGDRGKLPPSRKVMILGEWGGRNRTNVGGKFWFGAAKQSTVGLFFYPPET